MIARTHTVLSVLPSSGVVTGKNCIKLLEYAREKQVGWHFPTLKWMGVY